MTTFDQIVNRLLENVGEGINKVHSHIAWADKMQSRMALHGHTDTDVLKLGSTPNTSVQAVYSHAIHSILNDIVQDFGSRAAAIKYILGDEFIGNLTDTPTPGVYTFTKNEEEWMNIAIPGADVTTDNDEPVQPENIVCPKVRAFYFKKAFDEGDDELGYDISSSYF